MAIRPKGEGKMRRSLIKILVLALILSVMLTALNYEPRANYDPEEKRFACIINYGFNYWTGVQNGAEEAGEDDNVSIDVYSFELMDTQPADEKNGIYESRRNHHHGRSEQ